MENQTKPINGAPDESIYQLDSMDRSLGRLVDIPVESNREYSQCERDLASDSFWGYLANKETREDIPDTRAINRRLIDWVKQSPNYTNELTRGNLLASSYASAVLHSQLLNDPTIKDAMEKQEQAETAARESEINNNIADALQENGENENAAQYRRAAQEKRAESDNLIQSANELTDKITNSQTGAAIRAKMVKDANEESEKMNAIVNGWGLEDGIGNPLAANRVGETIQRYKNIMPTIAALMGRVKGIARKVKGEKKTPTDIITGDGYTQNLTRIFPGELSLLRFDAPEMLRAVKMGEYADRGLIGMITGTSGKEEGDIIIIRDGSGSMDGEPANRAAALALGIGGVCKETNQGFHAFTFSSSHQIIDLPQNAGLEESMQWAVNNPDGGTDFDAALNHAVEIMDGIPDERKNGLDIGIITDGIGDINEKTRLTIAALKETYGIRILYLAVGDYVSIGDRLESIIDQTANITMDQSIDQVTETLARFVW